MMKATTLLLILFALYLLYHLKMTYIPESIPFAGIPEHYGCGCGA
jgi:hypothetical protein